MEIKDIRCEEWERPAIENVLSREWIEDEKLKMLREARHLTQLQVAERVGISKAMISAYETAIKTPMRSMS